MYLNISYILLKKVMCNIGAWTSHFKNQRRREMLKSILLIFKAIENGKLFA